MLIGYARVSRADGSQRVDLERDTLAAAGVPSEAVYKGRASGQRDGRPGLEAWLKALRSGDTRSCGSLTGSAPDAGCGMRPSEVDALRGPPSYDATNRDGALVEGETQDVGFVRDGSGRPVLRSSAPPRPVGVSGLGRST